MHGVAVQLLMHTYCGFVVQTLLIVAMYGTLKLHCAAVHINLQFKQYFISEYNSGSLLAGYIHN